MFSEFRNNSKIVGKINNKKNSPKTDIKLNKTEIVQKTKYNNESSYLRQYKKYFQKKLSIKYNILPKEYTLMQIENFIKAKYCHSLAKFKEDLLYNLQQEFFKKYYKKKESLIKLPLFSDFYKTYLLFFCSPTLSELNLNELIEEMVERKAKAFYQENYQEEKDDKRDSKKIINTIFFTNKIRKEISRKNTLTDLSKTTIDFITTTNKTANSNMTINLLINEIGKEKEKAFKNNILINKNMNANKQKVNLNKNDRINKIIKKIEDNINNKNNKNKKRNFLKNSSKTINQDGKSLTSRNALEGKLKTINNTINNLSNKNIIGSGLESNLIKNKENNISKPLYHKINIVNNKIIIINNNRSKGNILKNSKVKLKKKNNISRNYNNNLFSTYNNNIITVTDSKDRIINSSNNNTNTFLLKTFKEHSHKKELSSKNCQSMQIKSETKIKKIKKIKEKKLNNNKQETNIQAYNTKKLNSNLFADYLNNYKHKNNNTNLSSINKIKKKKLTNYQMFSNNIKSKNINKSNKGKFTSFYKMIRSTCSLGSNSNKKINSIIKISNYNTLENISKIRNLNKNIYRKQCSTQEEFKTKLQINNKAINKNAYFLKINKK